MYIEETEKYVAMIHGDTYALGKLDKAGTFTPDRKYPPVRLGEGLTSSPGFRLLNGDPGTAYEYRSGRLILGYIDQKGNFVPDLGSKVIAFEDYRPGGNAPPIYNLPGRFVKKGEEKGKDKP